MDLYFQFPQILDENKNVLNTFKDILTLIKNKSDISLYYSEKNLNDFKSVNEETEVYLTDEIKIIRQFLFSSRANKVETNNDGVSYLQWNLDLFTTLPCEAVVTKIAKLLYKEPTYLYSLINLEFAIQTCRNQILVFRDSKHLNLPDYFVKIDFVNNINGLKDTLKLKNIIVFSLENNNQFQKVSSIYVKGAICYFEKNENRYWHLDTFHNYVEYEVYDNNGKHIATADESGNLNFDNKKEGRKIYL